ncbi:hypothetical protein COV18_04200 [Candidatus Woesearchaeota archaeon CG10_big_fil_rev_8_21_14_0_10_37_12]|nr:MAG: hypothetical protein COV18_04200 [Candidatus Woesearchaeota archaeon CG10_big_fil_rev_8_21_14_0_10_37_12]
MSRIQYYKQETTYMCGPAVLRMILAAFGIRKTERQAAKLLGTNKVSGTSNEKFPFVAEKYKLSYVVGRNAVLGDVRQTLAKDYRVIICYVRLAEEEGHYAVVNKLEKGTIHLFDPYYGRTHKYPIKQFKKYWQRKTRYDKERGWFFAVKQTNGT